MVRLIPLILLGFSFGCVSPVPPFSDGDLTSAVRDSKEVIAFRISSKNIVRTLETQERMQGLLGDSADAKILERSMMPSGKWTNAANQIQGYARLSEGIRAPKEIKRLLTKILLDSRSYTNLARLCAFSPGAALQFNNRSDSADVLICFKCNQIGVFWRGTEVRRTIDPAVSKLKELLESFLPMVDDPFEPVPMKNSAFE